MAAIGRETFVANFGHLYPPSDLKAFLQDAHSPERYAALASDGRSALWLATRGDRTIGYALAGACALPHPDVTPACGELKRLYLTPEAQGDGTSEQLMRAVLDWLVRQGRDLWVGVYCDNIRAQRFYARHGFERVGEYYFEVGGSRDFEFILRRRGLTL